MLEQALASFCNQDYRKYQIIFGLQEASDPAFDVIQRLRARFPDIDIGIVVNRTQHGKNRKVSNLINMYPEAKHGIIVVADSDIHVSRDYLLHLTSELGRKGVGLVTTLYSGLSVSEALAASLGTAQINYSFLPGVLLGRMFGRQDCLGATMALRRETLEAIGGLRALVHHVADDNMLGRLVVKRGEAVAVAATLTVTTVPEIRMSDLFAHELRWGRTIRSMAPVGFACSAIQYPIFWAALAIVASQNEVWTILLFVVAWLGRSAAMQGVEVALGLESSVQIWMLPLRDLLSVVVILASFCGDGVVWRGHTLCVGSLSAARTVANAAEKPGWRNLRLIRRVIIGV